MCEEKKGWRECVLRYELLTCIFLSFILPHPPPSSPILPHPSPSSPILPGSHSQTLHPAFRPCSEGDPSSATVVAPCDRPRRPSSTDQTITSPGTSVCPPLEHCATLDGLLDLNCSYTIQNLLPSESQPCSTRQQSLLIFSVDLFLTLSTKHHHS